MALEIYTSRYTAAQQDDLLDKASEAYTPEQVATLATIMSMSMLSEVGTTTLITNPEWKIVLTDHDDRILLGKRQDDTWYFGTYLDTILDVIISSYTVNP